MNDNPYLKTILWMSDKLKNSGDNQEVFEKIFGDIKIRKDVYGRSGKMKMYGGKIHQHKMVKGLEEIRPLTEAEELRIHPIYRKNRGK